MSQGAAAGARPPGVRPAGLPAPPVGLIEERLAAIRRRIEAAAPGPGEVKVVAVTKGFAPPVVTAAVEAGLTELGENYAQELLAKTVGAPPSVRWHFLGALQRRRVPSLARHVAVWESMDRAEAADMVATRQPGAAVLIQVNLVGDPGKLGCAPDDAPKLVEHCRARGLDVRGLMTVGPAGDLEGARRCFAELAAMADDLGIAELSMGMSDDFEVAVAEGATSVRLGRALFGPRPGTGRPRR